MQYLFQHPMPVPWLLADLLTILVTLLVVLFIVRRSKHPVVVLLVSCVHFAILGLIYFSGINITPPKEKFLFEP